jgi:DNA-binding LytR/AlgR family response regulator
MNCIIIDDDTFVCRVIEEYIAKTDGLTYIASFYSPQDISQKYKTLEDIDILFLDIEMPGMNGFDFLKTIKDPPIVIIMSANGLYAIDAFSFQVTDFLLKPVSYARFLQACEKVKSSVIQKMGVDGLFIKKNKIHSKIFYKEIYYIEALSNYCIIHTKKEKIMMLVTMKQIENKFPKTIFRRTHKSFIANLSLVLKVDDITLEIGDKDHNFLIPLGRNYKNDILSFLNIM